jgi:hypothetical protein
MKVYEFGVLRSMHRETWKCYEIKWEPLKEEAPLVILLTWKNYIKTNLRLSTS